MLIYQNAFKLRKIDYSTMNKFISIFVGLILLATPILAWGYNLWNFGESAVFFLKGGIIFSLIILGIILIFIGMNDLKD